MQFILKQYRKKKKCGGEGGERKAKKESKCGKMSATKKIQKDIQGFFAQFLQIF